MNDTLLKAAKATITDCLYLNIASITSDGLPWNTPVYFTFDKQYNFYWGSPKDSVHSQNIRHNSEVFLTIYPAEESGTGVYIQANAFELADAEEITEVLKILDRKDGTPTNTAADFLDDSPLRMYKAIPRKVSVSSPEISEKYNGLWVDHRLEIALV